MSRYLKFFESCLPIRLTDHGEFSPENNSATFPQTSTTLTWPEYAHSCAVSGSNGRITSPTIMPAANPRNSRIAPAVLPRRVLQFLSLVRSQLTHVQVSGWPEKYGRFAR